MTPVTHLGDAIESGLSELTGIDPLIDRLLDVLEEIGAATGDQERTANLLLALGGGDTNVTTLISHTIARLGNPAENPAIADLTATRRHAVATFTARYALAALNTDRYRLPTEAAAQIHGG